MPMKEQYYTIDGQMVGYKGAGGRKDYLTDNLGSVTSEVDQTGNNQTFIGRYKPYGGTQSSSGASGSYQWVGSWGYRSTGLSASSHYVRARHYSKTSGNWTTTDPLWPNEHAYWYARSRVMISTDRFGLTADDPIKSMCGISLCDQLKLMKPGADNKKFKDLVECMAKQGFDEAGDAERIRKAIQYLLSACPGESKSPPRFCLYIASGDNLYSGNGTTPVDDPCGFALACHARPDVGLGTIQLIVPNITPPRGETCGRNENHCADGAKAGGGPCSCVVFLCKDNMERLGDSAKAMVCKQLIFHEMVHCAGFHGGPDHALPNNNRDDFVYNLGCCMCKIAFGDADSSCDGCNKRSGK